MTGPALVAWLHAHARDVAVAAGMSSGAAVFLLAACRAAGRADECDEELRRRRAAWDKADAGYQHEGPL